MNDLGLANRQRRTLQATDKQHPLTVGVDPQVDAQRRQLAAQRLVPKHHLQLALLVKPAMAREVNGIAILGVAPPLQARHRQLGPRHQRLQHRAGQRGRQNRVVTDQHRRAPGGAEVEPGIRAVNLLRHFLAHHRGNCGQRQRFQHLQPPGGVLPPKQRPTEELRPPHQSGTAQQAAGPVLVMSQFAVTKNQRESGEFATDGHRAPRYH